MRFAMNWFNKKRKVSIEDQLIQLHRTGITLKINTPIENILERERREYERNPYIFLLMSMGSEYQAVENSLVHPSDDVWYLDRECIEDHGDYSRIVERIAGIVGNELDITNIYDVLNIEKNEAFISLVANGKVYKFIFHVEDDWLDMSIFMHMSKLLKERGSNKRFYHSIIDQHVLIVFLSKEQWVDLNKLLNIFIPCYLGEGGEEEQK
ncbi:hypothetical protein [Cohnella abietis]|uniref:Uncharacterized protein n=1 Tax=Cohnella abietis TaxID=2507935 RepID=A0A3T1DAM6_9BACL|nr:hypothetical protein [Cohnella abietis]BBI35157.1 hypothetical protein KCTCHS21_45560 [Cohnella abietis]